MTPCKTILAPILYFLALVGNGCFAQGSLWGMTAEGGRDGAGVIFKTKGDGTNLVVQHNFTMDNPGAGPFGELTQAPNGKLYGLTNRGGLHDEGVLFEYDPQTASYSRKFDFDLKNQPGDPLGSLTLASNGKLYGTLRQSGTDSKGILYEFDPVSGQLVTKIDFGQDTNEALPVETLTRGNNGIIYGLTYEGGANGAGAVFSFDPTTGGYVNLGDFSSEFITSGFRSSLFLASNARLYGVTRKGGTEDSGTLYEFYPTDGTFLLRFQFGGEMTYPTMTYPTTPVIAGPGGKLYGIASTDNVHDGVIFSYDTINQYVKEEVELFLGGSGVEGFLLDISYGKMIVGDNGKIYGVTIFGGEKNAGRLFEYDPSDPSYLTNFHYKVDFGLTSWGSHPHGGLVKTSTGKIFGTVGYGGSVGYYDFELNGALFEFDPASGNATELVDLSASDDGYQPLGSLTLHPNGKLYGLTSKGGLNGGGTLFEYDTVTNVFTKKIDFESTTRGIHPSGDLVVSPEGSLFGVTDTGGTFNKGVIFEYNPETDTFIKRVDMADSSGASPRGGLTFAGNKLYGVTVEGGSMEYGTLFEFDPVTGIYTMLVDLNLINGANPQSQMVLADNGKLYGTTPQSNVGLGILFELNPVTSAYSVKHVFDVPGGGYSPYGRMIKGSDGKLYGTTYDGGAYYSGVIYRFDPNNGDFFSLHDFQATEGVRLYGGLVEGRNKKFFGMSNWSGPEYKGDLFQFDATNSTVTVRIEFSDETGRSPMYSALLFADPNAEILGIKPPELMMEAFPNPTENILHLTGTGDIRSYELINSMGQLAPVELNKVEPGYNANVTHLCTGVYLLRLETTTGMKQIKFVKK